MMEQSENDGGVEMSPLQSEIVGGGNLEKQKSEIFDKWGFSTTAKARDEYLKQKASRAGRNEMRKTNERLAKWTVMLKNDLEVNHKLLKRRCRKGIPDAVRGRAWMIMSGAQRLKDASEPGLFQELQFKEPSKDAAMVIEADLDRTFTSHSFFNSGKGQKALRNVLRAYAVYDSEIGYMQSMAFVVALFLMYVPEEDAFWLLVAFMTDNGMYKMRGMYKDGLAVLKLRFGQMPILLKQFLPRLAAHFDSKEMSIHPVMYCAKWFLTIYSYDFPFDLVVRIWDAFFCEGEKIVWRVALQVLKNDERNLLSKKTHQELVMAVQSINERVTTDLVMDNCFKLKLKGEHILRAEKDFQL